MKRTVTLILASLLMAFAFAESIPSGRVLLPLVLDCANDRTTYWNDVTYSDFDPKDDNYIITGYTVNKNIVGYIKQTFTVTIKGEGEGSFSVSVSDMSSVACNKDGTVLGTAKSTKNPSSTMKKLANLIGAEMEKRISTWSDEEYAKKYDMAVTDPFVLNSVANKSALIFKKFISDNQIIGKPIHLTINVTKVDEAPKYAEGYSYYVGGEVLVGYDGFGLPKYASIMVYTNNENVVDLSPADAGRQSGSKYEVNGVIKDISRKEKGGLSVIQVNE